MTSSYKEKQKVRRLFKLLKAGIKKKEELSEEDLKLLRLHYPFLFR